MRSGQTWVTIFICMGAALVYLSVAMESAKLFVIGELICLAMTPFVAWSERRNLQAWFKSRRG